MLFEDKYRNSPTFGRDGILRRINKQTCRVCGRPTMYVDTMTEEPVCSEECLSRLNEFVNREK